MSLPRSPVARRCWPRSTPGTTTIRCRSRLDWLEQQADLLAAQADALRGAPSTKSPVWAFHHMHLSLLLHEGSRGLDPTITADVLLSALDPQLFLHQRRERGTPLQHLHDHWELLMRRVFD